MKTIGFKIISFSNRDVVLRFLTHTLFFTLSDANKFLDERDEPLEIISGKFELTDLDALPITYELIQYPEYSTVAYSQSFQEIHFHYELENGGYEVLELAPRQSKVLPGYFEGDDLTTKFDSTLVRVYFMSAQFIDNIDYVTVTESNNEWRFAKNSVILNRVDDDLIIYDLQANPLLSINRNTVIVPASNDMDDLYSKVSPMFLRATQGGVGDLPFFNGSRLVTRDGVPKVNVGGTNVQEFIDRYFFPTTGPQGSITGGVLKEFGSPTDVNLNWTVTRNDEPISSITINDTPVSDPITGDSQNGVELLNSIANINTRFDLEVIAGVLSDFSSTEVRWANRNYIGLIPKAQRTAIESVETEAELFSLSGVQVVESQILESRPLGVRTYDLSSFSPNGGYVFWLWSDGKGGSPSSFWQGAFSYPVLELSIASFTNSFGYSAPYKLFVSQNASSGSDISITVK